MNTIERIQRLMKAKGGRRLSALDIAGGITTHLNDLDRQVGIDTTGGKCPCHRVSTYTGNGHSHLKNQVGVRVAMLERAVFGGGGDYAFWLGADG